MFPSPEQLQYFNAAGEYLAAMSNSEELDRVSMEAVDFSDVFEVTKDDLQTVGDGAVDVRGRPSIKSRTGNWRASALIFGNKIDCNVFIATSAYLGSYVTQPHH